MDINNHGQSYQGLISMLNGQTELSLASELASEQKSEQANEQAAKVQGRAQDKVSLSSQGEKLGLIAAEFFTGSITSSNIPKLTERLYQQGLIDVEDYQALAGGTKQSPSEIAQSVHFLNRFVSSDIIDDNSEGAQKLLKAVDLLQSVDRPSTPDSRREESSAYDYISSYTDLLRDAKAPQDLMSGFETLEKVFEALSVVRNNEKNGALASYASVQSVYNENNKSV